MTTPTQRSAAAPARLGPAMPIALYLLTVLAQMLYPAVSGTGRDAVTIAVVLTFSAASLLHAAYWRGWRAAGLLLAVAGGGGFAAEALGVATGIPFGAYAYSSRLGPAVAGVPLVIPLAWTMMAYPALLVGRAITGHRIGGPFVAGAALATWDLFLDPQMVTEGYWTWAPSGGPHLYGTIPLLNFAGWFAVATVMMAALWRPLTGTAGGWTPPPAWWPVTGVRWPVPDDRPPLAMYVWVYLSSVVGHALFFGLPASALIGGLGMGLVVALLVRAWRSGTRAAAAG